MARFALALALTLYASIASAQTIVNPNGLDFDHADYAGTASYVLGYFASATAASPVQEAPVTKPGSCAPCSVPLASRPTAFQPWWVGVRAVAGSMSSVWSEKVPFDRAPLAPANLRLKP